VRRLLGMVAAAALIPAMAVAQAPRERPHFGVQASYGNDSDFGVGVRFKYSLRGLFPTVPLSGTASADAFFPGNGFTWWDFNYNVTYALKIPNAPRVGPYAGGGINFAYVTGNGASDGKVGINVLGGMTFGNTASATPFIELRGVIGPANQMVLTGGLLF